MMDRWYLLMRFFDEDQTRLVPKADHPLLGWDSQERAVRLADDLNHTRNNRARYFVVHESELPLFGLEIPAA